MTEMALVTREQEHQTATSLYGGNDQLRELFDAVKAVAPWANGKESMTNNEIALVVRKAVAMGLDPLNAHEVQIWKDKRGAVNFQIGYPLMVEWVRHFHGEHTEPRYHRLSADELKAEGLQAADVAYRVTFLMKADIGSLQTLSESGYDPQEARAMLEVSGLGVATAAEYQGEYFAPAARSRSWKVQKRAMVDAYRRKFGTPNRSEIEELRRIGGFERVHPEDWEGTEELKPGDAGALAKSHALDREHREALEDPEYAAEFAATVVEAQAALYPEAKIVEAQVRDVEPDPAPAHWIDDPKVRTRFWAWTKGLGLSQGDVYVALKVESVHSFTGTMADAKATIEQYVARNTQPDGDLWDQEEASDA